MPYLVGALLALGVVLFAALAGFDRDRAFYPTVLIVTASYYDLFAILAGGGTLLALESAALAAFAALAVIGFRTSLWWVVAGLAGHALFDLVRGGLIVNPGVPTWWPAFCLAFDLAASAAVAFLLRARRR